MDSTECAVKKITGIFKYLILEAASIPSISPFRTISIKIRSGMISKVFSIASFPLEAT